MAEDSGAFKTNPSYSASFQDFVIVHNRCRQASPFRKHFPASRRAPASPIFNNRRRSHAVFLNQLIRFAPAVFRPRLRMRASSVATAFPDLQGLPHYSCEGGICRSMLPGFRFLSAAIVLSMSILVFGLGAAALLRTAHEEFASNPSWRAPPETMFAQQAEAAAPVLAMLQIEPQAAAQKAADDVPAITDAAESAAIFQEASIPEAAKSETPVAESRAQRETTSAQANVPVDDTTKIAPPDAETKVASSGHAPPPQISAPADEAALLASEPAAPGQANAQAPAETDAAMTKIATLGGPPITIKPAPAVSKKIDEAAAKKRLAARRVAQRRRAAARARLAAQQAQQPLPPAQQQAQQAQQQAFPFGQPSAQPLAAPRR